jgi:hypothetical protein
VPYIYIFFDKVDFIILIFEHISSCLGLDFVINDRGHQLLGR